MLQRCAFKNLKLWEAQLSNLRILPGTSLTPATTALRAVFRQTLGPYSPMPQCSVSTAQPAKSTVDSAAQPRPLLQSVLWLFFAVTFDLNATVMAHLAKVEAEVALQFRLLFLIEQSLLQVQRFAAFTLCHACHPQPTSSAFHLSCFAADIDAVASYASLREPVNVGAVTESAAYRIRCSESVCHGKVAGRAHRRHSQSTHILRVPVLQTVLSEKKAVDNSCPKANPCLKGSQGH